MKQKKGTVTPGQDSTDLRDKLREALEITSTDAELVHLMIANGTLQTAVEEGTYTTEETAQILGVKEHSVRVLANKSAIFPRPMVKERRYPRYEVQAYASTRQNRPTHATDPDNGAT